MKSSKSGAFKDAVEAIEEFIAKGEVSSKFMYLCLIILFITIYYNLIQYDTVCNKYNYTLLIKLNISNETFYVLELM